MHLPRYDGTMYRLPNGGSVGLRHISKSGPPTIDVHNVPGLDPVIKLTFVPK